MNTISGSDAGSESSLNPQDRENRRMAARPKRSVSQNPTSKKAAMMASAFQLSPMT